MTDNTPNQSQPTAQQPLQRDAIYARLRRTIRIQWAVLAIALLLIIHVTTSLFEKRGSTKFNQPIESPLAVSQIGEFRNDVDFRKKVRIIWYEPDQITGYMSGFFKAWTDAHELPKGQRWVVGFYPMRRDDLKKEDGEEKRYKNRVDFLIVPTIVDDFGNVLDFADESIRSEHYKAIQYPKFGNCDTCVAFDAGHLWP